MSSNEIGSILENHFGFFATKNSTLLTNTSEKARIRAFLFIYFFPLEIIGKACRIYNIESLCIFNFCSKWLELNNIILGLYIWLFLSIIWRGKLEMTNRSLGISVKFNYQFFLIRIQIFDRDE